MYDYLWKENDEKSIQRFIHENVLFKNNLYAEDTQIYLQPGLLL